MAEDPREDRERCPYPEDDCATERSMLEAYTEELKAENERLREALLAEAEAWETEASFLPSSPAKLCRERAQRLRALAGEEESGG